MQGIELLYDFLEDHVRAAAAVRERKPLSLGVVCFLFGGLSLFMAQALAARMSFLGFSVSAAALAAIWKLTVGFILTALLHMIVEMSGKTGSAASLFVLFGIADLTWAAAVPLILIARLVGASSWVITGVFLVIGIFTLGMKARSLQDNYQLAPARAWLTLSLPYLAAIGLTIVAFSIALVGVISKIIQSLGN